MNESAPAPARLSVPWWERVAAGVLVVGWGWWMYFEYANWWMWIQLDLEMIMGRWRNVMQIGFYRSLAPFDSSQTTQILLWGVELSFGLGLPLFIGAGLWVAAGPRLPRLRLVCWIMVLTHALVLMALRALAGRLDHLDALQFGDIDTDSGPWHGGWLSLTHEGYYWSDTLFLWIAQLLLAALVLTLGWWHMRRERAIRPGPELETLNPKP